MGTSITTGEPWGSLHATRDLIYLLTYALQDAARARALLFNSNRVGPEWLDAVLERIDSGLSHPELDVNELAAVAHLSPSHFAHMFRRYAGISPKQLLLRKRMERASALLVSTQLSIKEIASRSGYSDPYHFSAIFKSGRAYRPFITATAARRDSPTAAEKHILSAVHRMAEALR